MYDLSIVTDALLQVLTNAVGASPIWGGGGPPFSLSITGQHPAQIAPGSDCDLNLYLFHVGEDKFQRNSFWTSQGQGGAQQPGAYEPLALDLWYVLSAQSGSSYAHEQQSLSVGMRAFHDNASVTLATPTPPPNPVTPSTMSLVLESPTFDELSRLWQALGVAMRTTAQYRASVVFLTPQDPPAAQPKVQVMALAAAPTAGADSSLPVLLATTRHVSYTPPAVPGMPLLREYDQEPASTAPAPAGVAGQEVVLLGTGLTDTDVPLLVTVGAGGVVTETDLSAWKVPLTTPYPTPPPGGVPITLRPPATAGACPSPGQYQLQVSRPSLPGWRSDAVPLEIAAWIDPTGGPLLNAAAGLFTIKARNIPAAGAQLRLGTAALTRVTSAPSAGQWRVSGNTVTFKAPADVAAGTYAIRLRVNNVEADPAQWAVVP